MAHHAGLPNFGNTCYVNTTIQCIFSLPCFKLSKPISELGCAFKRLRARYKTGHVSVDDMHDFLKMCKSELCLNLDVQNDMQEFYLILVNKLIEKEGRDASENIALAEAHLKTCSVHERFLAKCRVAWWRDLKSTWSSMIPVLNGQVVSQTKCPLCGYIVHNPELFMNIDVDLCSDLIDAIKKFYSLDIVEDWKCDKCQVTCGAGRILKITNFPKILVITLKRFDDMGNKKKDHVRIPRVLTMPEDTHVFENPQTYKLRAMGCHQGCQYGGHYYAAIMSDAADVNASEPREHVTIVNDEIVSRHAGHALHASHEPYMLFYLKT